MVLGAFLDAGLPLDDLKRALGSLALGDATSRDERVLRAGVSATKFTVHEHAAATTARTPHDHGGHQHPSTRHHPHRQSAGDLRADRHSALSPAGRDRAKAMFQRLAEAEAAIHQMPVEKVHLHEVGALDSIIDIVGIVFALEWAGADRIVCSPLNVGGGMVQLGARPVSGAGAGDGEAARRRAGLQRRRAEGAGHADRRADRDVLRRRRSARFPSMSIERVGYGAGDRDDPTTPNVLRVLIGRAAADQARRPRHRHRVRDRRHEPADLRRGDGSAVRRRRARGVLRAGADEEESPGHAADRRRAAGAAVADRPTSSSARRPRSACGTTTSSASVSSGRSCTLRRRSARCGSRSRRRDGRVSTPSRSSTTARSWPPRHNLSVKEVQAIARAGRTGSRHEPFLPHDRDRLRQQPAASRHGLREGVRRRHRALQAAVRHSTRAS